MKIIFLDIDGVLNNHRSLLTHYELFDSDCMNQLNRIMKEVPDVLVVISSTWRLLHSISYLLDHFEEQGFYDVHRIISCTPSPLFAETRGEEIQAWLDDQDDIDEFVIIDDDNDMVHLTPHLVRTNSKLGLTKENADQVIRRLS